ncbi:MAG: inner membrane CreD family protein [Vicinamibacterales bacterium]
MTVGRLVAIALIFVGTSLAWAGLGSSLLVRSGGFDGRLEEEVELLWGRPHRQVAPTGWILRPGDETETTEIPGAEGRVTRQQVTRTVLRDIPIPLEQTRATVDLDLEQRQRGLLWYPTYTVAFDGVYRFSNPDAEARVLRVRFPVPAADALLDDFVFSLDGRQVTPSTDASREIVAETTAAPNSTVTLTVRYTSRGMRRWIYAFADTGVTQVQAFDLTMRTNFDNVDFPPGTVSPDAMAPREEGRELNWQFDNLISGQAIGMEMPERISPGFFAARVTFFAPVSLLFFLTVMVIAGATSGASPHPMHYWFIAAAFFAFHLLLAYLVDHINLHLAFAVAVLTSVGLLVTYLRAVVGLRRMLLVAAAAQIVFLVLFSYAFFLEGFTGLTITVGAIITLFVLMQTTARVSWDEVFARRLPTAAENDHARG